MSTLQERLGQIANTPDGDTTTLRQIANEIGLAAKGARRAATQEAESLNEAQAAVLAVAEAQPDGTGDDALLAAVVEQVDANLLNLFAPTPEPRPARPATEIRGDMPPRLIWAHGREGAILTEGEVMIVAGEGGVAKSALAVSLGIGMAGAKDGDETDLGDGVFGCRGGTVLHAVYEDRPEFVALKLRACAECAEASKEAVERNFVMDMSGLPIFGPTEEHNTLYNSRPAPLAGWGELWREAERARARLVVIDPALAAYVGDANSVGPVREFVGALTREARRLSLGVLLIAHSTKAVRGSNKEAGPYEPGLVAGSSAWTDSIRGVATLKWRPDDPSERMLAVAKANYGPARILIELDAMRMRKGLIVGFRGKGEWSEDMRRARPKGRRGRRAKDDTFDVDEH